MKNPAGILCLILCCLAVAYLQAAGVDPGFEAGLSSAQRPQEDRERDAVRRPGQVIEFLGIESGMTVMDIIAAGGYYTEVLSAAVGPEGRVISQNSERILQMGDGAMARTLKTRVDRLNNVDILLSSLSELHLPPGTPASTENLILGHIQTSPATYEGKIDAAITALNLHDVYNFGGEEGARAMLETIYKLLKPGAVFGVIDHVGSAGQDNAKLHRIERNTAKELLTGAGFEIAGESDVLANPDDDHTLNIWDEALGRNTDRMLIKARKPGG